MTLEQSRQVITITELNNYIKNLFERDSFLCNVWIKGEISNFTQQDICISHLKMMVV